VVLHDLCRVALRRIDDVVCAKGLRVSLDITDGFTELPLPAAPLSLSLAALASLCVMRAPHGGQISLECAPERGRGQLRIEIVMAYAMRFDRSVARSLEPVRRSLDALGAELAVVSRPDGAVAIQILAPLGARAPGSGDPPSGIRCHAPEADLLIERDCAIVPSPAPFEAAARRCARA
jgi:hypothetical protein